jgi:type II secretory pathway pseudopilin PulG
VELLVAVTLLEVVAALGLGSLVGFQRLTQAHAERAALNGALRTGAQLVRAELRDLDAASGDLVALGPTAVRYRAPRGFGLSCGRAPGVLLLGADEFHGFRRPAPPGDSVLVYRDGPGSGWIGLQVIGSSRSAVCPDGRPGWEVPVSSGVPDPLDGLQPTAPVRIFETMEIRSYQSGGSWWLGTRSVSSGETIQPVAGPLSPTGFEVIGFDDLGVSTTQARLVRRLAITFRGLTDQGLAVGGAARAGVTRADSLTVVVRLAHPPSP